MCSKHPLFLHLSIGRWEGVAGPRADWTCGAHLAELTDGSGVPRNGDILSPWAFLSNDMLFMSARSLSISFKASPSDI
jgi:hypothetical protein